MRTQHDTDLGETALAELPELHTAAELASFALAVDQEAARRYADFAAELGNLGRPEVASLFERLAEAYRAEAADVQGTANGDMTAMASLPSRLWAEIFAEETASVCDRFDLTPYRIFAFAVGVAQRKFKLFSYLAAAAKDPDLRARAESFATAELGRAERLRAARRQAYHGSARESAAGAMAAARRIDSLADLLVTALAIETEVARLLTEAMNQRPALASVLEATENQVETLRRDSDVAGADAGGVSSLRPESDAETLGPERRLWSACERAFTFYDAVASRSGDETVMLRAQALSQFALTRIEQVRTVVG